MEHIYAFLVNNGCETMMAGLCLVRSPSHMQRYLDNSVILRIPMMISIILETGSTNVINIVPQKQRMRLWAVAKAGLQHPGQYNQHKKHNCDTPLGPNGDWNHFHEASTEEKHSFGNSISHLCFLKRCNKKRTHLETGSDNSISSRARMRKTSA